MRTLSFVSLLAACGGGGSSQTVVIHAENAAVAAFRTGDAWKELTPNADGDVTLSLDGPTQIVTVCDTNGFFNYYTINAGPGVDELEMYCQDPAATTTVTLSVTASPTTQVFVGFFSGLGTDQLTVDSGVYDVIAIDDSTTPPRFEIRRDVSFATDLAMTFDLAATGAPMTPVRVDVTGAAAGETLSKRVFLITANKTYVRYTVAGAEAFTMPAIASDRHYVSASVSSETQGSRSVTANFDGAKPLTLALPAYLTSATATFGAAPSITWQGDARWNNFYFGINDPDFGLLYDVLVLPEWTEAGGEAAIEIPDPSGIPGWQVGWNFPASVAGWDWFFTASEDTGSVRASATKSGMF